MNANTVRVSFDDEKLSVEEVVKALAKAGYAVPEYTLAN
jgi:copper chaperone CopZ